MRVWRFTFRIRSMQLTPWQADTLFGSICWMIRYRRGEDGLREFLKPFLDGDPPFLISDGFPSGYLPVPLVLRVQRSPGTLTPEEYQQEKRIKQSPFLPEEGFRKACQAQPVSLAETTGSIIRPFSELHASINRVSGTTVSGDEEGGPSLFQLNGWVPETEGGTVQVYVGDRQGEARETLIPLFQDLSLTGFGKKKSAGMGAFCFQEEVEEWTFPDLPQPANGYVSLSGFVPARKDPTKGLWQLRVKHGKLGESYAVGGQPFKKPWIHLEPGACFFTGTEPEEVYGRMLNGLSDTYPEVVQYGYSFPVPCCLPQNLVERLDS